MLSSEAVSTASDLSTVIAIDAGAYERCPNGLTKLRVTELSPGLRTTDPLCASKSPTSSRSFGLAALL